MCYCYNILLTAHQGRLNAWHSLWQTNGRESQFYTAYQLSLSPRKTPTVPQCQSSVNSTRNFTHGEKRQEEILGFLCRHTLYYSIWGNGENTFKKMAIHGFSTTHFSFSRDQENFAFRLSVSVRSL